MWHLYGAILISVEKRLPHYSLTTIKATFATADKLRMTQSANNAALSLGFDSAGVVTVIQTINRSHFYKSMTSHADHKIWQDVYHVPANSLVLYVKFTTDVEGYFVIQFKEK